ncbi:MAG: hypothetical protein PVG87_24170 [Desulfobacteraceae bacterium]|jgi:hypothetical protein
MKKILFSLALILLVLPVTPTQSICETQEYILIQVAYRYFSLIKNKQYYFASELFHYPEHYSKEELIDDKNSVSNMLELITSELGEILDKKILQKPVDYYNIVVYGGDIQYWGQHTFSVRLEFEVIFKNEGKGYLIIYFCNLSDKWEFSKVAYGLPASKPSSKKRLLEISKKLFHIIHNSTKKNNL